MLTAVAVSTADDGTRLSALVSTLTICLLATGIVVVIGRWLQRRFVDARRHRIVPYRPR